MYKLSIIVPVYNVEDYLPACLESIDSQTVKDFEIILVDDGATDSSGKICDKYAEKHPENTTVIHQENAGLGGARNSAIKIARGEYLVFLDSDDTLTADAVEQLCSALEAGNPDIVIFPLRSVDESGNTLSIVKPDLPAGEIVFTESRPDIITGPPNACGKMIRKSLFTDNSIFFPNHVWYEDLRTIPKLYVFTKTVYYLEKPLYNYLMRQGSIMNNAKLERNAEIIDAINELYDYFTDHGVIEKVREELDFLAIYHVFIAASVRIIRAAGKHRLLDEFRAYTYEKCKNPAKNKYVSAMPMRRKLVLFLLRIKSYSLIRLLFRRRKD